MWEIINALIAAGTSIMVVILSQLLIYINNQRLKQNEESDAVLKQYLSPARFMLSENYFRINQIVEQVEKSGKDQRLLTVNRVSEIAEKPEEWFNGEGCYLVSTCYLLACMFSYIEKIRFQAAFFKMSYNEDTELIKLVNKLSAEFSKGYIYYVIQMDIGQMISDDKKGVRTYREFCNDIKNESNLKWFRSVFEFFLNLGQGNCDVAKHILEDIQEFSQYIDHSVSGGDSIKQKLLAEQEVKRKFSY